MRNAFFKMVMLLIGGAGLRADGAVTQPCDNPGGPGPVAPFYELCVIGNFDEIGRLLDVRLPACRTFNQRVDIIYTNCINDNFRQVDRKVGTYSRWCDNFGDQNLTLNFQYCINQNFRDIDDRLGEITTAPP